MAKRKKKKKAKKPGMNRQQARTEVRSAARTQVPDPMSVPVLDPDSYLKQRPAVPAETEEHRQGMRRINALLEKQPLYAWVTRQTGQAERRRYEFAFMTRDGRGRGYAMEWPLFLFDGIPQETWTLIRDKIRDETLTLHDLRGTRLSGFSKEALYVWLNNSAPLHILLNRLLDLPDEAPDHFYALFPCWIVSDEFPAPRFFLTREELLAAFQENFCQNYEEWGRTSAAELAACEKLMREHSEIQIYRYGDL